ncbi:hypothetical protein [Marinicauda sp. Alg238-R41]|uniref:hypothetical protein n=1 Tax=Marinicauda sp. Alg238-R41 TaxID=2993447 RepID=UPI0022E6E9C2|nr:hypothetical protein [Marinicauda sp. Alg238-R41]
MTALLTYGQTPVPYTASWTGEERMFVGPCEHAGDRQALCQEQSRGQGRPEFGKPHMVRQREVIARGLCDLCARPLKTRTKVSLSHARVRANGAEGPAVMQVEPLLHRECAAESCRYCPSLKKDIRAGTLFIRQVTRYRVQFAVMDPRYAEHYGCDVPEGINPVGHAKVELLSWRDRDTDWLMRAAAE